MLQSLHIKNFAIIDALTVDFSGGLTVMTGETGAGKTIVLQALGLLLGARASTDLIRSGEEAASVTASFRVDRVSDQACELLSRYGIDAEDELVIHRVLNSRGKGKAAINGVPVTQQMLKGIAPHLVDVSSQHEHQILLDPAHHALIIDRFGGLDAVLAQYQEAHRAHTKLAAEVDKLKVDEAEASGKLDFLKFQYDELKGAGLEVGEDSRLEAERNRSKNAVALEGRVREAEAILYGEAGSAGETLGRAARLLEQCERHDPELGKWRESLERCEAEVGDLARDLARYAERLDSDPARLESVEERLHLIRSLKKKHGGTIDACLERLESIAKEIDLVERHDEILAEREAALEKARARMIEAAERLSRDRKRIARTLAKEVGKELAGLGMKRIEFDARMERLPIEAWEPYGPDAVEFMISPNVGEDLRPLARIASGGELSRLLLAVKRVLADRARLAATYIFDEVDAGIGGATAEAVGRKLKEVASSRQVICITHLPQVAAQGDHHFRISKRVAKGRTVAEVTPLSDEERSEEIARMLGGARITAATQAHAEEMLGARQG